jgi:hypothetical protein
MENTKERREMHIKTWAIKPERKGPPEDLGTDGRIMWQKSC